MKLIKIKKVYEPFKELDGYRILVDRLWPRGLNQDKAKIDLWLKEIAPSNELRKWYNYELEKWPEFKRRYFSELATKKDLITVILDKAKSGSVTLLFSSKVEQYNNAVALSEYLKNHCLK